MGVDFQKDFKWFSINCWWKFWKRGLPFWMRRSSYSNCLSSDRLCSENEESPGLNFNNQVTVGWILPGILLICYIIGRCSKARIQSRLNCSNLGVRLACSPLSTPFSWPCPQLETNEVIGSWHDIYRHGLRFLSRYRSSLFHLLRNSVMLFMTKRTCRLTCCAVLSRAISLPWLSQYCFQSPGW